MELNNKFNNLTYKERLTILCARIYELEYRTYPNIEWEKLRKCEKVLWNILDKTISDDEWLIFCLENKMVKYLKYLNNN